MTTRIIKSFCLLLLLFAWPGASRAAVVLAEGQTSREITSDLQFLRDDSRQLGVAGLLRRPDTEWQQNGDETFSHGYTTANWWLRFPVGNSRAQSSRLLLELAYPVLDQVEVWVLGSNNHVDAHYQLGDKQPFHERILQHRFFLIPLELPPGGERTVLLRLHTASSMQAPLTLWEERAYFEQDQHVLLA